MILKLTYATKFNLIFRRNSKFYINGWLDNLEEDYVEIQEHLRVITYAMILKNSIIIKKLFIVIWEAEISPHMLPDNTKINFLLTKSRKK